MPRELVWTGSITVDGKVDSPGGTAEGHAGGGWVMQTDFVHEAFALKDEELTETFSADVRQARLRGLRTGLERIPRPRRLSGAAQVRRLEPHGR